MTKKIISLLAVLILTCAGFGAEFKVDTLVNKVAADLKHAPAIVSRAAVKNPKFIVEIVSATVGAFPDQAVEIVQALLLALPEQFEDIVQAAILAQPKLAVQITAAAVSTLPDQAADIIKTAEAAAPADVRSAIAAVNSSTGHPPQGSAGFPVQPIRPDVVSPSH